MKHLKNTVHQNMVGEIAVGYIRKENLKISEQPQIRTSKDCYNVLRQTYEPSIIEHREEFMMLCLNKQNRVLGWAKISSGGVSGTYVDAKVIFQIALNANASSVVLCHNHPSGNTKPSQADFDITKKVVDGGKLLDITVLDHLILVPHSDEYFSFTDEGHI